jgi:hypothetical protein
LFLLADDFDLLAGLLDLAGFSLDFDCFYFIILINTTRAKYHFI